MKEFFREVIVAIKEGPALFFAPVIGAIWAARQPTRRPLKKRHSS
jgi:hypothetical protein